jgi:phosphate transport system permease protein
VSTGAAIARNAGETSALLRRGSGSLAERLFRLALYAAVAIGALVLIVLLVRIVTQGDSRLSTQLFTNQPSKILPETSGIQSAVLGTLYLMALCALIVVPLGVATAVYLEEYADRTRWWNRLIEVNIQNLAAVPSVVYGILGLAFIVRGPLDMGPVLMAGAITLSLLVLPVVIIVAREAIRAVPPSIREGAMALGATKWQTIWKQVLPGSIAGIATGVILALSRAIGETAPLIVIGAAVSPRFNPEGLFDSFTALPIQIFAFSKDSDSSFIALAAAAIVVLMGLLLAMNSIAIYLRNRYEQKW